ncbi:N-acetylmuramoyl-L-alanine amidase family protein [Clostridium beijerinckii]|uniref:N-acetylmuramoyl-L-alanine amidase family protein n=1 Tax=Clostridium beijerinckii TaxID=1520 RepID=UPI00047AEBCB|nr:cadherin-like beta sandwich domain-containing protein [Clostridium beijerinckii]
MNKGIKCLISATLIIGTFSVLEPGKYINVMNIKAYADSDIYLKGINVTDGDPIELNSSKKTYSTDVPNSDKEVVIRVTTYNKDDKVTIDGDKNPEKQSDTKFKKTVTLEKGTNTFDVTVESEDGEKEREYTLKIDRGGKQSSDSESVFLDNINLDFGDLVFSKDITSYDVTVPEDVEELRVQAEPENNNYIVRIDGLKVDDDDKFRKEVKLSKGQNSISIDVEDDEDDENTKTYTLNVYRGKNPSQSTNNTDNVKFDNKQDEIYLDDIVLDDNDVKYTPNFNKKITSYSVDVPETSEDIIIKGEPENGSNIVKINGTTADSKNRKRVSLTKGKNVIEVQVNKDCEEDDDDYEKRIYTLTIYRGTSEGSSLTESNATNSETDNKDAGKNVQNTVASNKVNQWINVNGKWQYYDSTGKPIKGTWYLDKNYGKYYFLNQDGNMATGWLLNNGSWYYLEQNGAMVTGWKQLGSNWYCLDSQGKMRTGWFKDADGKWYYLGESGAMSVNTTVGNYKVGTDGTWIR